MKKLLTLLLALCMMFTACGGEPETPENTPQPTSAATPSPQPTAASNIRIRTDYFDGSEEYCFYFITEGNGGYWRAEKKINGESKKYFKTEADPELAQFAAGRNTRTYLARDNVLEIWDRDLNYIGTINFNDETISFKYRRPHKTDDYIKIAEKNGYTLYEANHDGGGDITYYNVVLYNNRTEEEWVLGKAGGMYGGGSDVGFFSNGDVYILNYDSFETFDTKGNKLVRLGDNYPFGELDNRGNLYHRVIRAVRRDPVDFTYLVVYFEEDKQDKYEDYFLDYSKNQLQRKATYKVGHFDKNGYLLRSYDTTANAVVAMGFAPVDMWLEGSDTVKFFSWHKDKDNVYNKGSLNLTTGEFTLEYNAFEN